MSPGPTELRFEREREQNFLPLPLAPERLYRAAVNVLGDILLRRVRPPIQFLYDCVREEGLTKRPDRHDEVRFQDSWQVLLVEPGMGPIVPGALDKRVVFPFNRIDAIRAFDDREVQLPRDA